HLVVVVGGFHSLCASTTPSSVMDIPEMIFLMAGPFRGVVVVAVERWPPGNASWHLPGDLAWAGPAWRLDHGGDVLISPQAISRCILLCKSCSRARRDRGDSDGRIQRA